MSSRKKRAKKPPKKHIIPFVSFVVVFSLIAVVSTVAVSAYALADSWLEDMPKVTDAEAFNTPRTTTVYASDGTTILAKFFTQNRVPVGAGQVSQHLFDATIAIEDERYWSHEGIDPMGIARAAWVDLTGGAREGASTITQQLVRQTLLKDEANEISFRRKIREMILAMDLEKMYGKEEVLMMYLNTINYGDGAWGIQSAAQHYFSKDASQLTVTEAALLAGIPQSPAYNNPVSYPDNALVRRNLVLDRMLVNGYISEEECAEAKASELNLNIQVSGGDHNGIYRYPYFTSYVQKVLEGYSDSSDVWHDGLLGTKELFTGGYVIYTTIDPALQEYAEAACWNKEQYLDGDVEVSLTCVDPNTGYIKAMRGGKDYYADQFNTSTDMRRSPGSCFKVFALVACLEMGVSPQTSVSGASPVFIDQVGGGTWRVENYQGGQMSSGLSLAQATWLSSNTAYARVVRTIGAEAVVDTARRMGITSELTPSEAIVLGAQGVNTLEMASAFGTLGVGGIHYEPMAVTDIYDNEGNLWKHYDPNGVQAVTPEVAYAATNVLKGVISGGTGSSASLGFQVSAGKTGTGENYMNSFFTGYTPQLSTAVWIGCRAEERYIEDNLGGANCCPVWRDFMTNALQFYETGIDFPAGHDPEYTAKMSFMTPTEKAAADAAAAAAAAAAEAQKKKEEEEKKKAEEAAKPPTTPVTPPVTNPDPSDPGGGGTVVPPTPPPTPTPTPTP